MRLKIEEVSQEERKLVSVLEGSLASVGRDLTCDIPLVSEAVSRNHGVFYPFESGWAFLDQGSTNGTWVNGQKVIPFSLSVISDGDYLQLADLIFKLTYETSIFSSSVNKKNGWRLFALHGDVKLGNLKPVELNPKDFQGYITAQNCIAFEQVEDDFFLVFEEGEHIDVTLNSEPVSQRTKLSKGDFITCGEFYFLVVFGDLVAQKGSVSHSVIVPDHVSTKVDLTSVGEAKVFAPQPTSYIEPERIAKLKFGERRSDSNLDDDNDYDSRGSFKQYGNTTGMSPISEFFYRLSDVEKRILVGSVFFLISSLIFLVVLLLI